MHALATSYPRVITHVGAKNTDFYDGSLLKVYTAEDDYANPPEGHSVFQLDTPITLQPEELLWMVSEEFLDLCEQYNILTIRTYVTSFRRNLSSDKGSWCFVSKDSYAGSMLWEETADQIILWMNAALTTKWEHKDWLTIFINDMLYPFAKDYATTNYFNAVEHVLAGESSLDSLDEYDRPGMVKFIAEHGWVFQ